MPRPDRRPARLRSTFARSLHDERRALAGWTSGMVATVLLELALYPTVRSNDVSHLLDSYPKAVKQLFAVGDFTTGTGFVRTELFSLVIPMALVIFGILWGADAIAGEEERGTIDLLLANPISRRRLVGEKAAAVGAGLAVVGGATFAALLVGNAAFDVGIGWAQLASATIATVLLAATLAAVALAVGAATGHRGLARGATAAFAVASYLLSSLAPLVSWLEPLRNASPWYHALGVDPLGRGPSWGHLVVLVALAALALGIGAWRFGGRDLAT